MQQTKWKLLDLWFFELMLWKFMKLCGFIKDFQVHKELFNYFKNQNRSPKYNQYQLSAFFAAIFTSRREKRPNICFVKMKQYSISHQDHELNIGTWIFNPKRSLFEFHYARPWMSFNDQVCVGIQETVNAVYFPIIKKDIQVCTAYCEMRPAGRKKKIMSPYKTTHF